MSSASPPSGTALILEVSRPPGGDAPVGAVEDRGSLGPVEVVATPLGRLGGGPLPEPVPLSLELGGSHALALDPAVTWWIEASSRGFYFAPVLVEAGDREGAAAHRVELRPIPAGDLLGRIAWPLGSAPTEEERVRGLTLRVRPAAEGWEGDEGFEEVLSTCPVGSDGTFRCSAVPAGHLDLRLQMARFVPIYRWGLALESRGEQELGRLELIQGASLFGQVVLEDGEPAPAGTPVLAAPYRSRQTEEAYGSFEEQDRQRALGRETEVGEQGFFQVAGLTPGWWSVEARAPEAMAGAPELAPARLEPVEVKADLEARLAEPLVLARAGALELQLDPPVDPWGAPWIVEIRSFDRTYDEPGAASRSFREVSTDAEGRVRASGLSPGDYLLSLLSQPPPGQAAGSETRWMEIPLEIPGGSEAVEMFVPVPVIEVTGRLERGGEPVAGSLWFGGRTGSPRVRFEVEEDGAFEGYLPGPGNYPVDVEEMADEDTGPQWTGLDPVEVPDEPRVELVLAFPDTEFEVEVVDGEGRAIPGARVEATRVTGEGPSESSRLVDDEGELHWLGLPPGRYAISASTSDGRESRHAELLLQEGRRPPTTRLVIHEPVRLVGTVRDERALRPGARVVVLPQLQGDPSVTVEQAVSGVDGAFEVTLPGPLAGATVLVDAPGAPLAWKLWRPAPLAGASAPLHVRLEPLGGRVVLDLSEASGGASLLGKTTLSHGGATLVAGFFASLLRDRLRIEPPGRFVLEDLEPGEYQLCGGAGAIRRMVEGRAAEGGATEGAPPLCTSGYLAPGGELVLRLAGEARVASGRP